jgi:hypothetical protein
MFVVRPRQGVTVIDLGRLVVKVGGAVLRTFQFRVQSGSATPETGPMRLTGCDWNGKSRQVRAVVPTTMAHAEEAFAIVIRVGPMVVMRGQGTNKVMEVRAENVGTIEAVQGTPIDKTFTFAGLSGTEVKVVKGTEARSGGSRLTSTRDQSSCVRRRRRRARRSSLSR